MSYQTAKTDWSTEDGVSTSDMNRWEGNPEAIKNEAIEFNGDKTFNDNLIQAWGKSGLLCKPALTSGMGTVITRSDSEYELANFDDTEWHTMKTLSLNSFFPTSSSITVYFQTSDDDAPADHNIKLLVNGSVYWTGEGDEDYDAHTITNVPAGPNYTYTLQCQLNSSNAASDLKARYFRLWVAEEFILSAWEKAAFGLSG